MAFITGNLFAKQNKEKETVNVEQTEQPQTFPNTELDLAELEFLLKLVGNADLKGHQVEMFYNLVIKLQNQYIQKTK